ncbi:MAG: porin [Microscillaceae bacterium]|jgi:hypothetical protein|nr:porin [Microscillaceae bacterium]
MKKYQLFLFILGLLGYYQKVHSQVVNTATLDTNDVKYIGKFRVDGYVDAYYGYDFSNPTSRDKAYFVSSARHNELTINLAYIDVRIAGPRFRARFVPGFGTYMNANYANEPGVLKNIVEGNAGVKLFKDREIWLDVGVLGSPFTNESAISKDHLMYTRSFAPEYVPYYLSGAKLTLPLSKKVNFYFYLLNGWQVIQDNNSQKSLATQVEYRPTNDLLINWNVYVGDERSAARPEFRTRYFSDLYFIYNPQGKFSGTACVYLGNQIAENQLDRSTSNNYWWTANLIGKYKLTNNLALSGRLEYFSDPNNVQITPINPVGAFEAGSASLGLNYQIDNNVFLRWENRTFFSPKNIFQNTDNQAISSNNWMIGSITVAF